MISITAIIIVIAFFFGGGGGGGGQSWCARARHGSGSNGPSPPRKNYIIVVVVIYRPPPPPPPPPLDLQVCAYAFSRISNTDRNRNLTSVSQPVVLGEKMGNGEKMLNLIYLKRFVSELYNICY